MPIQKMKKQIKKVGWAMPILPETQKANRINQKNIISYAKNKSEKRT